MNTKTKKDHFTSIFSLRTLLLILGFLLINTASVFAQDNPQNIEVKMKDGSSVRGELITETSDKLIVKTRSLGEVTILKKDMIEYRNLRASNIVDGTYWHENPNPTRNIYGPTGYGLRKGEGYYQNFMLFLNQVSYGFTDNFTLGVGVEIASILAGSEGSFPGFTITPKFTVPIKKEKWNVGVGALALHIPNSDELFSAGILYGVSTWGSRDNNLSLGLGFGITEGDFTARPTITVAGNIRLAKRFGLVTENWIIPIGDEYGGLMSLGGRYIGERITWDFAILGGGFEGEFELSPIPLVGIAFPFGTGWKS